jgi:peptide/nickel transport system substrate-binding protein
MNVPRSGQTVAAPVAISPIFDTYDHVWEQRRIDPLVEMATLLEYAGIADFDNDSFLEISDGFGSFIKFTLDFIVNIENAHKLAAAQRIAENLRQFGFSINIRELQWNDFIDELQEGNFDMYYGETLLGADFNFSALLLPGEGNLNFGRTANTAYLPLINSFLAASTREEVSHAGGQLCHEIMVNAPFIPILYKRYAVYSPMGVITGATPSQSGVFQNFQDWSIDLYMLN